MRMGRISMQKQKMYDGKIPFFDYKELKIGGKLVTPAYREQLKYYSGRPDGIMWMDNLPFYANLKFRSMSRSRSAANFDSVLYDVCCDENDEYAKFLQECHVNIFMTDMLDIIQNATISQGITNTYKWIFCKRGSDYGIRLMLDDRT